MTLYQALILGIVQGATEFLPISSSAHLVLVPWLLGWTFDPEAAFAFGVLVHWGTALAVILYFRSDLKGILQAVLAALRNGRPLETTRARLGWLILVGSIPTAIAGLLGKQLVSRTFSTPTSVSVALLVTAGLLFFSQRAVAKLREVSSMTMRDSFSIGLAQAVALLPGISRSGATIAAGLTRGLHRQEAARFSFLLGIPVMLGAGASTLISYSTYADSYEFAPTFFIGFLAAALIGYLAIRFLLHFITRRPLTVFAMYCTLAGIVGLVLSAIRG